MPYPIRPKSDEALLVWFSRARQASQAVSRTIHYTPRIGGYGPEDRFSVDGRFAGGELTVDDLAVKSGANAVNFPLASGPLLTPWVLLAIRIAWFERRFAINRPGKPEYYPDGSYWHWRWDVSQHIVDMYPILFGNRRRQKGSNEFDRIQGQYQKRPFLWPYMTTYPHRSGFYDAYESYFGEPFSNRPEDPPFDRLLEFYSSPTFRDLPSCDRSTTIGMVFTSRNSDVQYVRPDVALPASANDLEYVEGLDMGSDEYLAFLRRMRFHLVNEQPYLRLFCANTLHNAGDLALRAECLRWCSRVATNSQGSRSEYPILRKDAVSLRWTPYRSAFYTESVSLPVDDGGEIYSEYLENPSPNGLWARHTVGVALSDGRADLSNVWYRMKAGKQDGGTHIDYFTRNEITFTEAAWPDRGTSFRMWIEPQQPDTWQEGGDSGTKVNFAIRIQCSAWGGFKSGEGGRAGSGVSYIGLSCLLDGMVPREMRQGRGVEAAVYTGAELTVSAEGAPGVDVPDAARAEVEDQVKNALSGVAVPSMVMLPVVTLDIDDEEETYYSAYASEERYGKCLAVDYTNIGTSYPTAADAMAAQAVDALTRAPNNSLLKGIEIRNSCQYPDAVVCDMDFRLFDTAGQNAKPSVPAIVSRDGFDPEHVRSVRWGEAWESEDSE